LRGVPLWRGQGEDLSLEHKPCSLNLIGMGIKRSGIKCKAGELPLMEHQTLLYKKIQVKY